jgi:hypothetical protein
MRAVVLALTFAIAIVGGLGCGARGGAADHPAATVVDAPPPPPREERVEMRRGFIWVRGSWQLRGGQWVWRAGRFERERAGQVWIGGHWQLRGDRYHWVEGRWRAARDR